MSRHLSAARPDPDAVLVAIADYVLGDFRPSEEALATARLCLMDSLGCAFMALKYPACTKLLGPVVPGATLPGGVRVPGTSFELEPVQGAFNIGAMIRWLDYNDTWLAAEWGHPSDNFGAILAVADYVSRLRLAAGKAPLSVREVLVAAIQAYEIQGVLALKNGFNRVGLDHVLLVRVASTAVAAKLLGADRQQLLNALSLAFVDGGALRTYRHAPNTGSRKSWAAGDATSRAVRLALIAMAGEMGYPSVLTARTWGFQDSLFRGVAIQLERPLGGYVMENILFKISFPAEFHAQTAVEAAIRLHPAVKQRLNEIAAIEIETQESGVRIIDKVGPLDNPADRDHCIQYMVAIPLIHGTLTADHYENEAAADLRIDALRAKMKVVENERFSRDYLDAEKRSIANAVQVTFTDGSKSERVEVEYPVGHRRRRGEGTPLLEAKFARSVEEVYSAEKQKAVMALFANLANLDQVAVTELMDAVWKG